ncbi:MAG: sulfurtransferase [Nitrosopumilus sp.]|nr:sulfurtransferase [Nitrosopumilus sp.]MDA7942982.1 sulfurtransferase [Nitrosopumilus sp.]MDA7959159.1 sulfurtransferase [Nitrosopumilus sp.]MDA7998353.1 sulfurtransferase [Nitrosopumilus sp.]
MSGVTAAADGIEQAVRDNSIRLVDVRHAEQYEGGHIPGAASLPLGGLLEAETPEQIARLAGEAGVGDGTRAVIYDDAFGALASRVAWALEYIGHRDVLLLEETYSGWAAAGRSTGTGGPRGTSERHSVSVQPGLLATADYLESVMHRDGTVVLDNRERLNYLEHHIPGAVSLPYVTLGGEGRILRPPGELGRLLDNRGVPADAEIITYCGSVGTLSGLAYYALKSAGRSNARLYAKSFKEWRGLSKPVETQADANYWDLSAG